MASPAIETFLAHLEKSNLLSAEALEQVWTEAERAGVNVGVEGFAPKLVEQGLITAWQAEGLAAGRTSFLLGKYKLLGELGRGGMGAVYKAVHIRLGRIVALKVMAQKLVSDEQAIARFHREIEAAAALNHPHVVAAFDAHHVDGTHFLVMEYVEGESLAAVLKREHRLSIVTACDYIRQAALGLAHAHERGMAHRDIKPANLLVTRTSDGQPLVKILDMGLARFTVERGEETELTSTGQVMGTPDYIAPEQARSTKSADIRSDIYSLGCTLFRCLTGRLPFDGESVVEKLMARAMGDAPPLRQTLPEASGALEAVVAKMLAREPAARYQTPVEVAAALEPFSTANPSVAPRTGRVQAAALAAPRDLGVDQFLRQLAQESELDAQVETVADSLGTQTGVTGAPTRTKGRFLANVEQRQRADRRRMVQAGVGTLGLAIVATAVWAWWFTGRTHLLLEWPTEERAEARLEIDGLERRVPERGNIPIPLGAAGLRKLHLERAGYEPIDTVLNFARGETKPYRPEWKPTVPTVRRERFADLKEKTQALLSRWTGRLPPADDAELRSLRQQFVDERLLFSFTPDQTQFDKLCRQLPFPADYLKIKGAPEENQALDPQVHSSLPKELAAAWGDARLRSPANLRSCSLSPDGNLAATWGYDQTVYVWNLRTGKLHALPIAPFDCVGPPSFSPDGKFLACLADDIMIWSVDDRRVVQTIPLKKKGDVYAFTWIPNRSLAAWTDELHAVHLYDLESGTPQESFEFPLDNTEEFIGALAASRDGRFLAAGTIKGKVRIWELENRTSYELPLGNWKVYSLAFSPDSRQLAGGAHCSICLWDLATRELRYVKEATRNTCINSLSWDRDGKTLFSNTGTGAVALWNASDGTVSGQLDTRRQNNTLAALSEGGRRLVTAGSDGLLQVWEADSHEEILPTRPYFTSAAMDPLGEWVALGTSDNTIELRDLSSGAIRETIRLGFVASQLSVSPDRKLIGVVRGPGASGLYVVPLGQQREPRELREMPSASMLTFTPDATLLLATEWQGGVAAWSTADFSLKFKSSQLNSQWPAAGAGVAVSRDGRTFVMAGGNPAKGAIAAFRLPEGKNLYLAPAVPMTNLVVFAADHKRAITGAGHLIHLIDLAYGKSKGSVMIPGVHGTRVNWIDASPAGDQIVAALTDGKLWFLSAAELHSQAEIDVGSRLVAPQQALYTPEGRHVVTVNANGTVFVWRIQQWGAAK